MNHTEARARLAELDSAYADARSRYRALAQPARRGLAIGARAADLLTKYHADVAFSVRPSDEDELRALTREVADSIIAGGLTLQPVNTRQPGVAWRIYDPEPVRQFEEAQRAATDAAAERDHFAAEHADTLAEAERKDKMDALRAALSSDDPALLADALAELPRSPHRANVLTTDDLPS